MQALAHHLDHGNAAGHRALEIQRDLVLLGERGEAGPVMGEQRLVGGDDMLAGRERGLDRLLCHTALAANQLDEHVDRGILRQSDGVLHETQSGQIGVAFLLPASGRVRDDLDRAPGACGKLRLARRQQPQETAADGADPRQPKLQCITHGRNQNDRFALEAMGMTLCMVLAESERNLRMLRAAWRMRCSFSTSASRT